MHSRSSRTPGSSARGSPRRAASAIVCCRPWRAARSMPAAMSSAPRSRIISGTSSRTSKASLPRVEFATGLDGPDARCVVSIIGCTGDWFGGWDGLTPGSVDQFITADLKHGRLPEVIARGEPAVMVCHWPGMYFNGQETGFKIFQQVVERLHAAYDHLVWLKLSEIARYWAARELTRIERGAALAIALEAPFACPQFTLRISRNGNNAAPAGRVRLTSTTNRSMLATVGSLLQLKSGTFVVENESLVACFDLPKGMSRLEIAGE